MPVPGQPPGAITSPEGRGEGGEPKRKSGGERFTESETAADACRTRKDFFRSGVLIGPCGRGCNSGRLSLLLSSHVTRLARRDRDSFPSSTQIVRPARLTRPCRWTGGRLGRDGYAS